MLLEARRPGNWLASEPRPIGSPGACGSVASCPRRTPAIAPLRPPPKRSAVSPSNGDSLGKLKYTDASIAHPKDIYLRRATCAFWAGDRASDSVAWSLPEPVQTVYRAELFAVFVALEIFPCNLELVSDYNGVVDEAERIKGGGKVSPISRHAEFWARYRNALSTGGVRRVRVRWVPSHEKEGSDRVSPSDRTGNDHTARLANAQAKRIGPTARQGKLYDRRTQQLCAIQGIQLKIFAASQATDLPKTRDQGPRGPRVACGGNRAPACWRFPILDCRELRVWGLHPITSHGRKGSGASLAPGSPTTRRLGMYALKTLPCTGRVGLAGPSQPRRPRLKWNRANEARWRCQGEGGHQVVRYNTYHPA